MKSTLFIPEKINVGYKERSDTYTKKLAYIIYFDEKGKLRKETSWNGWRTKSLGNDIIENEPYEGFVLNKKAGDYNYGWDGRKAYARVFDPRADGFEFEITIDNLLYILEHTNSIKGKGLEGSFVYAWSGKDIILLPVDSPDYKELVQYNNFIKDKYKLGAKTVKVGATYLTRSNEEWTYIGKYDYYERTWSYGESLPNGEGTYLTSKDKKQHYYFVKKNNEGQYLLETHSGSWAKFIACLDEGMHEDYAEMYEFITHSPRFSPVDYKGVEYIRYTYEEFEQVCKTVFLDEDYLSTRSWNYRDKYFNSNVRGNMKKVQIKNKDKVKDNIIPYVIFDYEKEVIYKPLYSWSQPTKGIVKETMNIYFNSLRELFDLYEPRYQVLHLQNGKLYKEDK